MFADVFREKRQHERFDTEVDAVLHFPEFKYNGLIKNLSLGGAFFESENILSLEELIPFVGTNGQMIVKNSEGAGSDTTLNCQIVYIVPRKGIAIKFVNNDESCKASISNILMSHNS